MGPWVQAILTPRAARAKPRRGEGTSPRPAAWHKAKKWGSLWGAFRVDHLSSFIGVRHGEVRAVQAQVHKTIFRAGTWELTGGAFVILAVCLAATQLPPTVTVATVAGRPVPFST